MDLCLEQTIHGLPAIAQSMVCPNSPFELNICNQCTLFLAYDIVVLFTVIQVSEDPCNNPVLDYAAGSL